MPKHTIDPRALRQGLGLNQIDFWSRIEVTQSGGSRYEGGREMPKPVRKLLGAVYLGEKITPYVKRLVVRRTNGK